MLDVRTGKIKLAGKYYKARFRPIEESELKTIEKKIGYDGEFSGGWLYTIVKHADGEYYMQYLNGRILNTNINDEKDVQVSTLRNDVKKVPAVLFVAEINEKDIAIRKLIRETTPENESYLFKYNTKQTFKTDGSKMKILCQINVRAKKIVKYLNMYSDALINITTKRDVEQLIDKISMLTNIPATWIDENDSKMDFINC